MGNIITKAFEFSGNLFDLVASALGTVFSGLVRAAATVLEDIVNIFGNAANVPRKINEEVVKFKEDIGKRQLFNDLLTVPFFSKER